MLFNIHQPTRDSELLELFKITASMLPSVKDSGDIYGYAGFHLALNSEISIAAILGDQQAALLV